MRLYPKKLNSLEELRKEKHKLLQHKNEIDLLPTFSWDMLSGKQASTSKKSADDGNAIVDMIAGIIEEGSIATIGMNVLQSIRKFKLPKAVGNILYPIAKDVAMAYVRWKAIELGYKGMRMIIEKRRKKKQQQQAV
jgi:hypothetical protein